MQTPQSTGCACATCPFARDGRPYRPVLAVGPRRPLAIIVGESPGGEEQDKGEPFVGATGQELNAVLAANGLAREDLLLINAVCCRPPHVKTEGDMSKAVKACRPYIASVLVDIPKDTPMLICGKWAFCSITGKDEGYANERGFLQAEIHTGTAALTQARLHPARVLEDAAGGRAKK